MTALVVAFRNVVNSPKNAGKLIISCEYFPFFLRCYLNYNESIERVIFYLDIAHCGEMKKCYFVSMSRGISYVKYENGRLTGLVTSYVETAF